jgi:hypothetical protein
VDVRRWVETGALNVRSTAKMLDHLRKCHERVGDADEGAAVDGDSGWHDRGGGATGVPGRQMSVVLDERDVAWLSIGQSSCGGNGLVAIAEQFPPEPLCELANGDGHGGPLLPCKPRKPVPSSAEVNERVRPGASATGSRAIVVYRREGGVR